MEGVGLYQEVMGSWLYAEIKGKTIYLFIFFFLSFSLEVLFKSVFCLKIPNTADRNHLASLSLLSEG